MMFRLFFFVLLSITLLPTVKAQATDHPEKAAVEEAVWAYVNGRNGGDTTLLHRAFHPTADLRYVRGDEYRIWAGSDYISGVKPGRKVDCLSRIVFLDIQGNAAIAKVEIEYDRLVFADYINLLKMPDGRWQIAVKTFSRNPLSVEKRVLFVLTSHEDMGNTGKKTGLHLGEVSHVYQPLHAAGYQVDFVSPKGGATRMYGTDMNDPVNLWFVQHPSAYYAFTHAMTPDRIDPERYSAIYYVGGHGTMWDLPGHAELQSITRSIYESEGVVSGICHGLAGLTEVKLSDGSYLVAGKAITSFTDNEERATGQEDVVPFLLETRLRERGARFEGADNWQRKVVVDGRLVSGQNPASAYGVGEAMVTLLNEKAAN